MHRGDGFYPIKFSDFRRYGCDTNNTPNQSSDYYMESLPADDAGAFDDTLLMDETNKWRNEYERTSAGGDLDPLTIFEYDTNTGLSPAMTAETKIAEGEKEGVIGRTSQPTRGAGSKKRRRKGKEDPDTKVFFEPCDVDVLFGRGTRSNQHKGNKLYLNEKELLQSRYKAAGKEDKAAISQELIDRVHGWGGRFLKKDATTNCWFEVTNAQALDKCCQALREINSPERRAARRARYGK